jgi:hypothetical protein
MRGVSKRFVRAASVAALLTILAAQGAVAAQRDEGSGGWLRRFERAKHFIVTILDELGAPKG